MAAMSSTAENGRPLGVLAEIAAIARGSARSPAFIGVAVLPGAIALIWMPTGASSSARARTIWTIAALVAQ
ncbi:Uncharacterised protein [Mycobacteroides abscessus subsp. abscessus]|nr:Uncharacterised protein [Mycobacteroides abscessus subsp. abscessus]